MYDVPLPREAGKDEVVPHITNVFRPSCKRSNKLAFPNFPLGKAR